ncbi:hypothetical protein [Henriciella litoralis]|uniref:hypothetical protein n=1 Tax=Henriciella litoralis TaxID=568102 RepID=UPI00111C21F2|nr:hypothetical protein [Henriciella litoralis]
MTETTSGLPPLTFETDNTSSFDANGEGPGIQSALLVQALSHHANTLAADGKADLVSISMDVTGTPLGDGKGAIQSDVDRQTRTLLFIGAELSSKAGLHTRATAIFRIHRDE